MNGKASCEGRVAGSIYIREFAKCFPVLTLRAANGKAAKCEERFILWATLVPLLLAPVTLHKNPTSSNGHLHRCLFYIQYSVV